MVTFRTGDHGKGPSSSLKPLKAGTRKKYFEKDRRNRDDHESQRSVLFSRVAPRCIALLRADHPKVRAPPSLEAFHFFDILP